MINFFKLIISAIQFYINKLLKNSTADWNQNDENESNYIKNRTHWEEIIEQFFIPETTVDATSNHMHVSNHCTFAIGDTYVVNFNDNVYNCVAWRGTSGNSYGIGNGDIYGGYGRGGDEPFSFISYGDGNCYLNVENSGTYTISVRGPKKIIHKINVKYLPDDIGIQSDWEEKDENSKSYILNKPDIDIKLDKENPSGTGSLSMNRNSKATIGNYSAAVGQDVIAAGHASYAQGRYNIEDLGSQYALIIGNGISNEYRSNAHTVDWVGNGWFAGDVFTGSNLKKLATEEYVSNTIEQTNNSIISSLSIIDAAGYEYILQVRNGVLVTSIKCLEIKITQYPTKSIYTEGEAFDPAGMVLTATYSDGSTKVINDYTYSTNTYSSENNTFYIYCTDNYIDYTIPITVLEENSLVDFTYTVEDDGTYTLTGWNGTLNGVSSTELVIPNSHFINL